MLYEKDIEEIDKLIAEASLNFWGPPWSFSTRPYLKTKDREAMVKFCEERWPAAAVTTADCSYNSPMYYIFLKRV